LKEEKTSYSVPAVEKTIAILNLLTDHEMGINEIYKQLNLPKSSTFVILGTLENNGIIERTEMGKYRLSSAVFHWGMGYYKNVDIVNIVRPHLRRLIQDTPFTAHLAVLIDGKSIFIDKVEENSFVRFATYVGQAIPFYLSSAGKALGIGMTEEEITLFLQNHVPVKLTDKSPVTNEQILEDIRTARKLGYSTEDEQFEKGIRCIGAPVYNFTGQIKWGISIIALSTDLPEDSFERIGEQVKQTAATISLELGYRSKDSLL
jgi:DNA-binding IclR family transcriptional regulator